MNRVTSVAGIKTVDITFKGARRQSAIEEELKDKNPEDYDSGKVVVPVSLTPEQLKSFYMQKIEDSTDSNEKRVYSQTMKWIDELLEAKKKIISLESKEVKEVDEIDNGIE